ncbi:MAG: hypothetical protein ACREIC_19795 [Limisphaerales bacterium]
MNITVTKEDIEYGQRRDPENCAIARALARAGLDHFGVMGPSVMVADGWGRLTSLRLTEEVSDWIFNFDAGNPVDPLYFKLDLPPRPEPAAERTLDGKREPRSAPEQTANPIVLEIKLPAPVAIRRKSIERSNSAPKPPQLRSRRNRGLGFTVKCG